MPAVVEPLVSVDAEGPEQFEVMLQSVPKALCCGDYLEAMLEQAGLDSYLVSCRVLTRADLGEALLKFSVKRAAKKCVKHFDGRRWDLAGNCPAVKATLLQADHTVPKIGKSAAKDHNKATPVVHKEAMTADVVAIQYQETMVQYFSSAAGQQLLREECCSFPAETEEKVNQFNWEAVSDASDSEQSGVKQGKALSDASTVDGSSDAGDQEVF